MTTWKAAGDSDPSPLDPVIHPDHEHTADGADPLLQDAAPARSTPPKPKRSINPLRAMVATVKQVKPNKQVKPGVARPRVGRDRDAQLREVQERLRLTFMHAPVAQAVVDLEGVLLEVNPALCHFLGYSASELLGRHYRDLTQGDDRAEDIESRARLLAGDKGGGYAGERRYHRRDGLVVWGQLHSALVRDQNGEPLYFVTQIEDVSERRNREERLLLATQELVAANDLLTATIKRAQLNEERYRGLVNHLPDTVVIVFDRHRRLAMRSGPALAGRDDDERFMGKTPEEFLEPDMAATLRKMLDAAFAGESTVAEITHRLAGETLVEILPLTPNRGEEPEEVLLVSRDIQRFKQRERALAEAEGRWRAAFDGAPVAMAELTMSGRILRVNPAMCELTGWPAAALEHQLLSALVHSDDRDGATTWATMVAAGAGGQSYVEYRLTQRGGRVRWARARGSVIAQGDGPVSRMLVHLTDTTVEHEHQDRIAKAHARFSALVEHGSDVIAILGPDLRVHYASPAYERVFGVEQVSVLGTKITDPFHPDDLSEACALLDAVSVQPGGVTSFETRIRRPDGSWRWLEVTASNRLDDRAVEGLVCNCRDVTERVEATTRLAHQATHDALTGLPNRTLLLDRLSQALARAQRSGRPCALFFVDLDHFKRVNDTLGHAAGDQLLVAIAQRLRSAIRPGDSVARLGGDEFVVLAEDITVPGGAVEIAERIRNSVNEPITLGLRKLSIGCSVGIALSDHHQPVTLFQAADAALYRAKERGRDRWALYDVSMGAQAQQQLDTEDMLRVALDTDRLAVVYQPIVDLRSGQPTGTEALARVRTDDGTLLTPADFMTAAEDSGLIVPLGLSVLESACAQYARWIGAGQPLEHVAVNLSARQLLSKGFVSTVAGILDGLGMRPEQLCLELTETTIIDAGTDARACISDLKDLGVRLALDDFGTGWSSLSHLRRSPIDTVKIDGSFVAGLGTNPGDGEVIRAVIGLGRALNLTIIAEGIETLAQAQQLQVLGCDYGQGHLFGEPQLPDRYSASAAAFEADRHRL